MIDLIGDVHGHADKLEALLKKMGYTVRNGSYSHPERKALFVGDYIDRGPKIRETLDIVKRMVDNGNAVALMGNHEYNALCFHYQENEGGHLRKHNIKNIVQHYDTLKQFQNKQEEYEDYLEWIKTLPLFYEKESFRAVHACWDNNSIQYLQEQLVQNTLTEALIYRSVKEDTKLHKAIDVVLKGKEIPLPEGQYFNDKDGTQRKDIRIKWWEDPSLMSYKELSVGALPNLSDVRVPGISNKNEFYGENNKPVFFGHYWLNGNPTLYRNNICCLDYSVAKNGLLVAYRFENESRLDDNKLIYV